MADYRAGVVAAVMRNAWRGKHDVAVGPEFFFPSLEVDGPEPGPEDDGEFFKALVIAMGGKVVTKAAEA